MTAATKVEEQVQGLALHYLAVLCHQDVPVTLVTCRWKHSLSRNCQKAPFSSPFFETKLIFKTFLQNGTGVTTAAGEAQKYPRSEVFCFTEIKTFQTSKNIPNFETGLQDYFLPLLKERKTTHLCTERLRQRERGEFSPSPYVPRAHPCISNKQPQECRTGEEEWWPGAMKKALHWWLMQGNVGTEQVAKSWCAIQHTTEDSFELPVVMTCCKSLGRLGSEILLLQGHLYRDIREVSGINSVSMAVFLQMLRRKQIALRGKQGWSWKKIDPSANTNQDERPRVYFWFVCSPVICDPLWPLPLTPHLQQLGGELVTLTKDTVPPTEVCASFFRIRGL